MKEIVLPSFYSLAKPIGDVLREMAEAGVRLVEIHGDAPDRHIDLTAESEVDALAEAVRRLPIDVHSVHCAFSQPAEDVWDISQADPDKRSAAVRNRMAVVRAAERLGARHVVVHLGVRDRGDEQLSRSLRSLDQLVETAREHGVRIAVENLPPDHLGGSLAEVKRVLECLDPEVAGFCLDTGHAMLGQDGLCDYIRALGDRLIGIHWHGNNCKDDAHVCPGADDTEWDGFFEALDEVGYDLPVTVESVPPGSIPLRQAVLELQTALRERREPRLC